jgi:hypothetical protein
VLSIPSCGPGQELAWLVPHEAAVKGSLLGFSPEHFSPDPISMGWSLLAAFERDVSPHVRFSMPCLRHSAGMSTGQADEYNALATGEMYRNSSQ